MGGRSKGKGRALPCVFVDVNTQRDFLSPDGACPVANREAVICALRRAVAWAKRNHAPVVSAVDCHRREEVGARRLPQHCLDGTHGQEKIAFTVFGSFVKVEGDNTLSVPIDLFRRYQQVIFRKRTTDFFLNPKADRFLTQLPAAEYVIAGLGIEGSIKALALGLLARHKPVTVVIEACGFFDRSEAELTARLLEAKGVRLINVDELMARRLPRPVRYPRSACGQVPLRNGLYASVPQPAGGNGHRRARNNGRGSRSLGANVKSKATASRLNRRGDQPARNRRHRADG